MVQPNDLPSPEEFSKVFLAFEDDELIVYSHIQAEVLGLNPDDLHWLTTVGLPNAAAPFLNFDKPQTDGPPRVDSVWGRMAHDEAAAVSRLIGSNGSGDPIAIEPHNAGAVVYFNHDNGMQRVLINTSVTRFVACIYAFNRMIARARAARGTDAFLNGDISKNELDDFVALVGRIDPRAASGMWRDEVTALQMRKP